MPAVGAFVAAAWAIPVVQSIITGIGLSLLARTLFKPKAYGSALDNAARERMVMVRSAVEPHRMVIGMALVSGPVAYLELTGANKEYLHVIVLLAGHEVEAIEDIYFDDVLVGDLDASGNVTSGTFNGLARIKKHLGTDDQAADADLVAESAGGWTTSHKLSGIAYLYCRLQRDSADKAFPTGLPQIRALVKGKKFYDPRVTGSPNNPVWSMNPFLAIRDYLAADYGLQAANAEIDDTTVATAANAADERVTVTYTSPAFTLDASTDLLTFASEENRLKTGDPVVPSTTGSLSGSGLTAGNLYWYIRVSATTAHLASSRAQALAWTPGSPTMPVVNITGAGSGTHTLQPRAVVTANASTDKLTFESDERFIAYGDGVQVFSSEAGSPDGMPGGLTSGTTYYAIKTRPGEMKLATSYDNALAGNAIDITSAGTGTLTVKHIDQARYTANGTYTLGEAPDQIISALLSAGAGVLTYSQGDYRVFAGVYTSPTHTLDEDDLRGPITGTTGPDARELFNTVRGTYVDQFKFWQPTDFPQVTEASYVSDDDGETLVTDLELPMVTDQIRAQRLAKIHLERQRYKTGDGTCGEALVLPCKLTAFKIAVWDTVQLNISPLGLNGHVFRVTGWRFAWDENGPGVDLSVVREESGVFGWSAADAGIIAVADDVVLPDPRVVAAPTGLTLTSERATDFQVSDPNVTVVIKADWTAAVEPNGRYYEVQWKKGGQSAWQSIILQFSGDTEYRIKETDSRPAGSPDTVTYLVRARTISHSGAKSDWAPSDSGESITVTPTQMLADTQDVQEEAITTPASAFTSGYISLAASLTPTEIQRVTIDATGAPINIQCSFVVENDSSVFATETPVRAFLVLYREPAGSPTVQTELVNASHGVPGYALGGSPDQSHRFDSAINFSYQDQPAAGTYSYVLKAQVLLYRSVDNTLVARARLRSMVVTELKR